ncbi:MAG: TolC family protein [Candidatus Aminicenantes bacterium]|nr:TolC family protein [Candidatus Aminicenantes bacterium]
MKKLCYFLIFFVLLLPDLGFPQEIIEFTLEDIIRIGLKNNPGIEARQSAVQAKQEAFLAAKRMSNPEFEVQAGKGESYDGLETRNTSGFTISQPIENPFKRHQRLLMYENSWKAAESLSDFSKLELVFEIKKLFFRILFFNKIEDLSQKNFESIAEIQRLIEKRAKFGEVKELEAIKLRVETLKAQNELNKIRTELALVKGNLNSLLDNSLPSNFSVYGLLDFLPFSEDEESLVTKTQFSYPLIKQKEFEVKAALNNISRLKWKRLPDFKLTGFSNKELDGTNKGFGLSLDVPLWNFNSREIAEAEFMVRQHEAELRALLLDISAEVKSKLSKLQLSEQTLNLFHTGLLKQAEESLTISEVSYKEGEISLIDYLDSQRTFFSIMFDYQNSLFTWNMDKAALEKTIGEDIK